MLSVQGHRLGHLHRDPARGWRGRSSEDKFSTLERLESRSPRATPPPANQHHRCSSPPIRGEQWGGTKGKDPARWAWPSGRRGAGRVGAVRSRRCEAWARGFQTCIPESARTLV